jgi:hypothetical protein
MKSSRRWFGIGTAGTLVALGLWAFAPHAETQGCVGDCGGDGAVTVNELLVMVNVALGTADVSQCAAGDTNGDGTITINEILTAVNNALGSCGGGTSLDSGLQALARGDLRSASAVFATVSAANPKDDRARFLAAVGRATVRWIDSPDLRSLATRAGVEISGDSTDVCALSAHSPGMIPASAPRTGELLATLRIVAIPEITAILSDIRQIAPDAQIHFTVSDLPECLRPTTDVTVAEIDRGDLVFLDAVLETTLSVLDFLDGYDVDASLHLMVDESPQVLFANEPTLLTLKSAARLLSARDHLNNATGSLVSAIDAIRAETDNQDDDVLVIDADDVQDAQRARLILTLFQDALSHEVSLPIDVVTGDVDLMDIGLGMHERLDLGRLFSGQLGSLRSLLPPFRADGSFDFGRVPDPTFGGIAPDMTQDKIDNFLAGGPACAECHGDRDCDAYGFGRFYCGYCFMNCSGVMRRCSSGYEMCPDGIF